MNERAFTRTRTTGVAVAGLAAALLAAPAFGWQVESYYGTYDAGDKEAGHPAPSLTGPEIEQWESPTADRPYRIGVSFPHLRDPYWLAVNYGVIDQARELGIEVELVAAEGYDDITGQIRQVENLVNRGVEGLILASISYSAQDGLVDMVTQDIPVVQVINDIQAPAITAKAMVSFYVMGYTSGEFVAGDSDGDITVAFLPGPSGSGWAPDTLEGFKQALRDHGAEDRVEIVAERWGDANRSEQQSLIENVLNQFPNLDYLVGNAVAADAAPSIMAGMDDKPKVVSTYLTPPLYEKISRGEVAASPSDFTALQGRMAVDMLVRILNGETPGEDFPFRSGPEIIALTPDNIAEYTYEDMMGPEDWRPVTSVSAD